MIEFERIEKNGKVADVYEDSGIVFGFTEWGAPAAHDVSKGFSSQEKSSQKNKISAHNSPGQGFELKDLSAFFPVEKIVELKQVHSNIIRFAGEIEPGSEGDGIILEQKNTLAVIKTADCVPLFFWRKGLAPKNPLPGKGGLVAGIVHVGWQGLQKGIEKKLLELLEKKQIPFGDLRFFMGPAIEKDCYEVGPDLYEKFSGKEYRDEIFFKKRVAPAAHGSISKKNQKKYLLDIKRGIFLSLIGSGIRDEQIEQTNLCTYCEKERFPSYRRERKTGLRIYNFLYLKPG